MQFHSIYKSPEGEKAVLAWYEKILKHWSVPHRNLNIPTRHGNTFIINSGKILAPPLILLHGAGTNSAMWAGEVAEYSRSFRVYAVDLLGEPGKSAPNRLPWTGPAYAEWLEDILNDLKLEKASFLGLSQGAWTAIKFASYQPNRVDKLVLLSPAGIVPDKPGFVFRAIPLSLMGRWGIKRINRMLFGSQPVPKEVDEANILIMTHFKTRLGVIPSFTDEELRRLTMPVLLMMGAMDSLRDVKRISNRLKSLLPSLKTNIINEAGHALTGITPYILPFLESSDNR